MYPVPERALPDLADSHVCQRRGYISRQVGWDSVLALSRVLTVGLAERVLRTVTLICGVVAVVVVVKCCFTSTETVGLLGTGAQDGHHDFHTTPELRLWRCC